MRDFLVFYIEDQISVCEFKDGRFIKYKNNGEDKWMFDYKQFWHWWKDRVEFASDTKFSFVVLTDKEEFKIQDDIAIAENISFTASDIKRDIKDIPLNLNLISYPAGFKEDEDMFAQEECDICDIKLPSEDENEYLAKYYNKKTEEYKKK